MIKQQTMWVRLKKISAIFLLALLVLFFLIEGFLMARELRQIEEKNKQLNEKIKSLLEENQNLGKEIVYYSHPKNLERFLRQRLNYLYPGEKMIIFMPSENKQ